MINLKFKLFKCALLLVTFEDWKTLIFLLQKVWLKQKWISYISSFACEISSQHIKRPSTFGQVYGQKKVELEINGLVTNLIVYTKGKGQKTYLIAFVLKWINHGIIFGWLT